MKKILIPFLGVLFLIILTPVILGKIANSNVNKKIEQLKLKGIKIKEVNNNFTYFTSMREFEVTFDKNTKLKTWKIYNQIIDKASFLVTLKFKNLPITTANFDVNTKYIKILNEKFLENLKFHIVSKDLKTFDYKIDKYNEKDIVTLSLIKGEFIHSKYDKFNLTSQNIAIKNLFKFKDLNISSTIKDLGLYLVDFVSTSKNSEVYINDYVVKTKNQQEKLDTHLLGDSQSYKFEYSYMSDNIGIYEKNQSLIALQNPKLEINGSKRDKYIFNISFKWDKTKYDNIALDGGLLKASLTSDTLSYPLNLKSFNGDINITFQKGLLSKLKNIDKKYLNKNILPIQIKNGELLINGNRI